MCIIVTKAIFIYFFMRKKMSGSGTCSSAVYAPSCRDSAQKAPLSNQHWSIKALKTSWPAPPASSGTVISAYLFDGDYSSGETVGYLP